MTEHAEDPVGQASSKVVQYVSLATMAAEAIAQVRQQRAARLATTDERTVRALRAQHTAARAAARLQWSPVLDPRRRGGLSLADTGLAWAASQAWRSFDPEAQRASEQAGERLRELRPDVMARYDRLTASGLDEVEAMRRVAPFFDSPPARTGEHVSRLPLTAADAPTEAHPASARGAEEAVDTSSSASRQHYIDTGQYLPVDAAAAPAPATTTLESPARDNAFPPQAIPRRQAATHGPADANPSWRNTTRSAGRCSRQRRVTSSKRCRACRCRVRGRRRSWPRTATPSR